MTYLMKDWAAVRSLELLLSKATFAATGRYAHANTIIGHVRAAKLRRSGRDITDLSDDELIADLHAHRVGD